MSATNDFPDQVLLAWLDFIDEHMAAHPEQIEPLSADLLARAHALVGHIEVDLDEDLGADLSFDELIWGL